MKNFTVKEIVLSAAADVGVYEQVKAYFDGDNDSTEANKLLRCFNLVESELALDYLPLYAEDTVYTETGTVPYTKLTRHAVRVVEVTDEWENKVAFRLFPEHLKTQAGGTLRIRYAYAPVEKTLHDDSDYHLWVSVRLFSYGVAAEYCLAHGLFEEAAVWDKKYKDAIAAACREKPTRIMQSRRWV